ncbi:hypothetical protein RJT34_14499 [Clitoria ternatea]|uniref:Uncharacterized protein n=1 Tax=Clitoria ternatea TaxID=43366 RepID=A0AAN9PMQ6_CLITE
MFHSYSYSLQTHFHPLKTTMPFPWKKTPVTRISRIVADLQSPKRGRSLVVQTGFPTSLIDLFVKNQNRFKKHRSKKPHIPDDPPPPPPSPATSPPPPPDPRPPTVSPEEAPTPSPQTEQDNDGNKIPNDIPGRVLECYFWSGLNMVLAKILMVMVLVASVKKLTVGITVSAFALLFLEYAGKRVVLCPNSESFSQRVSSACVCFQKLLLLRLNKEDTVMVNDGVAELSTEIEVVEAKSEVGVCDDVAYLDLVPPSSFPCEVSECKIIGSRSRSGRFIRSKMVKKLVPKKFRGSKKEKKSKHNEGELVSEVSSGVGDDKLPSLEIEEVVENDEDENGDKLIRDDCGIACSHESVATEGGVKRVARVGNSLNSGSVVLVMVALAGLLLGRFQALVLSMMWCCLVKIVTSVTKCSVSNSS